MAWWWARALPGGLLLLVLLSGCFGEGVNPAPESGSTDPPVVEGMATLKGRILDDSLESVAAARVRAFGPTGLVRDTLTDETGNYELTGLEPGRHRVQFLATCCRDHGGFVELPPNGVRILNVRLEILPPLQVPHTEEFGWEGFVACAVNVVNTGPSCGATDPNDERSLQFNVQPGLKTMLVAMDWEPHSMNWDEAMRFRVMHGSCNSSSGSCTYVHVRGPPPLEASIDEKTGRGEIHFANITEEQRITVRVWPDGTPNVVYQQPFDMYFVLHYWEAASEDDTALPP